MKIGWFLAVIATILGSTTAALLVPKGPEENRALVASQAETRGATETSPAGATQSTPRAEEGILLVEEGKKAEMKQDWAGAAAKYEQAAKLWSVDSLKGRIAAVRAIREAVENEKRGKLAEACAQYELCAPGIHNKAVVSHKIAAIKDYQANYAEGLKCSTAGNLREALSFLDMAKVTAETEGFRTDAGKLLKEIEGQLSKQRERAQAVKLVLDAAVARGDLYVVVALCRAYQGDATLSKLHEDLAAMAKSASASIHADCAKFPATRMDESVTLQTIHLKDSKAAPIIGQITDETGIAVKVAVNAQPKKVIRLILKDKIDRIERKADVWAINNEKTVALLRQAGAEWQGKRPYNVLRIAGEALAQFDGAPVLADKDAQVRDAGLPMELDELVAKAAGQVETMCPVCMGAGKTDCPTCKGTKLVRGRECDNCEGAGRLACDTCKGTGRMPGSPQAQAKAQTEKKAQEKAPEPKTEKKEEGRAARKTTERVVF